MSLPMHYVLDEDGNPQKEPDLLTWARWFETETNRVVAVYAHDDFMVSTVFLGLDHNFGVAGGPVLWETMVFGGRLDQHQWRYRSRDDAIAGHRAAVDKALAAVVSAGVRDP